MGLKDLKTSLKDLKFQGNSRSNGSSEPYIRVPIPGNDENGPNNSDIISRSITDTIRVGKFLSDFPRGPLFIAKQVGLQLSNPAIETGYGVGRGNTAIGQILNTAGQVLGAAGIGPTRIYNLGINTIAQVPAGAFGIHFNRHGLVPVQSEATKYYNVVSSKDSADNRLVKLTNRLINKTTPTTNNSLLGQATTFLDRITAVTNNLFGLSALNNESDIIAEYPGGPDSVLGIGKTTIRRYDHTPAFIEQPKYWDQKIKEFNINTTSSIDTKNVTGSIDRTDTTAIDKVNAKPKPKKEEYVSFVSGSAPVPSINVKFAKEYKVEKKRATETNPFIIENRINNGRPGKIGKIKGSRIGEDKITSLPIFSATDPKIAKDVFGGDYLRDLIKFRFEAINSSNPNESDFIVFRAFLNGITYGANATWNSTKYNGRGELFYIYDSFTTAVNFNFKAVAQSRGEMKNMYRKLNYLMANLAPEYVSNRMRGPLMKLTIGNLVYRVPGFITSLNYSIPDDASWEIAIDEPEGGDDEVMLELPHLIDVSVAYTPIYPFLAQKSLNKAPFIAMKDKERKGDGGRWIETTPLINSSNKANINK